MAADLDQALGVGTEKHSETEMAADLDQALEVGNLRNLVISEKL